MTDTPLPDESNLIQIRQGKMSLSFGKLPDLGCLLVELGMQVCRGRAMLQYLEPKVAAAWLAILKTGRKVRLHVDAPPNYTRLEADATIVEILEQKNQMEIVLNYIRTSGPEKLPFESPVPQAAQPAVLADAKPHGILYRNQKLGEVLVKMGHLTAAAADEAVHHAQRRGERLGRYLAHTGILTSAKICRALALQTGIPMTDLSNAEIDEHFDRVFSYDVMRRHAFITFDASPMIVCIAVADPLPPSTAAELERLCGRKLEVFLALEDLIVAHLDKIKSRHKREPRKFLRYELNVPVEYQFCGRMGTPAEERKHSGITRNICEDGFLIEGSPAGFGSTDDIRRRGICVNLCVSGPAYEVRGLCQLRFVKERQHLDDGAKTWQMGLKIVEMSSDDRRHLKELCFVAVKNMKLEN